MWPTTKIVMKIVDAIKSAFDGVLGPSKEEIKAAKKITKLMKKDFSGSHSKEKLRSITFNEEGNLYQKWMGDKLEHDGYQFSNGYLAVLVSANGKRRLFVLDRNQKMNIDIKIDKQTYNKLKDLIDDFRAEAEIYEYYERAWDRERAWERKYDQYKREHRESNQNQRTYPGSEKPKTSGNPKLDKLEEKIKLREEQLAKMPRNSPERAALANELEAYKRAADRLRKKGA
jgi:hypothetical protein